MDGVRCMLMRGGTSKGAFFTVDDLPSDSAARDDLLLRTMGSPDPRQIDGLGGAHPLTTKVAVVGPSPDDEADVDYLFLQVVVDEAVVTDRQNCGNMLAAVGPFAVERGLISGESDEVEVRIRMLNTGGIATARFALADGRPVYDAGPAAGIAIAGVPGTAAPIGLDFEGTAGASCGALLPTGRMVDVIDGVEVTLIDNGMPVVVMRAADVGVAGTETPADLEANVDLRKRIEAIRLLAGPLMNLGDVADLTVPKLTLVSSPVTAGHINTRTFIPHRCHDAIGVLGAVSVATAAVLPEGPAADVARLGADPTRVAVEHPTGSLDATVEMAADAGGPVAERSGILRTARKLMDGVAFPRPLL